MLAAFLCAALYVGQSADVTVYVFTKTDPSGFSDTFQAQRLESLAHLKASLEKQKAVAVVEQRDGADLVIEVLAAGKLETGTTRTQLAFDQPFNAGTVSKKDTKPQVWAMLRAGTYELEIHGSARNTKLAADAVAEGVEKWIKQNSARLAK